MPSFADSAIIFVLALLLFGPKKLPELARYVGKLMGEFRRASSEFRLQMEDEFRVIEQAEQQKKIAAIEAAAPIAPLNIPEPEHPHLALPQAPAAVSDAPAEALTSEQIERNIAAFSVPHVEELNLRPTPSETVTPGHSPEPPDRSRPAETVPDQAPAPVAIASNGDLHMKPPASGLPVGRSTSAQASEPKSIKPLFESIPHVADPETEASTHG